MTTTSGSHQWRARPVLGGALRCALLAVPLAGSTGAVYTVSRWLPPDAARSWWGLCVLLGVALAVALVVERGARRLLPIALLLKLSMIFPDRAPSRLRLARAAVTRAPKEQLLWHGTQVRPVSTSDLVLHLVTALGSHDRRTRGHSERVRLLTDMLAAERGLDQDARDRLRWSALLHDLGKMQVPAVVLNKPSRLDARELESVRQHPAVGAQLAQPLMPWLGEWGEGILDHHEKYDGTGYPAGKAGEQICLAGRLIGLVDAFETMTAARPYKKAVAAKAARAELARCAGSHFDPVLVRSFLAISLPRVLWAMGPTSFLLCLPFLRPVAYAGARGSAAAPQAASSLAAGAAGAAAGAALVTGGVAVPAAGSEPPDRQPVTASQPLLHAAPGEATPDRTPAAGVEIAGETTAAAEREGTLVPDGKPQPVVLEPALAPAEDPADEPAADPAADPADDPTDQPADEPAEPPVQEPLDGRDRTSGQPQVEQEVPSPAAPPAEAPRTAEPAAAGDRSPAGRPTPPVVDREDVQPPPAERPGSAPTAPGTPAQEVPAPPSGAILSGPPTTTTSREATFQLADVAGRQWECQLLRNGAGGSSAWQPCSGTWSVTLVKDGDHAVRVRDAATREPAGSWSWTVTSPADVRDRKRVSP